MASELERRRAAKTAKSAGDAGYESRRARCRREARDQLVYQLRTGSFWLNAL
ncbi:MAG TPA: hypothetical protein PLI05_00840 [Methanotrichaceae archaeon]|nr:hypothetical protein [Methanotrichaceae archaeon]HQF15596.1 hypothetical protein [Methanotrichaceae archaeon]HQI90332.1 hypothetical protein [Methanotrichaceae archaeon]